MDRPSKQLIKYLTSNGGCEKTYDFGEDLDNIAQYFHTHPDNLRANIRHLHKLEYIDYQKYSGSDRNASFALSHKGLHWKYFRRQEIIHYLQEKWIDFFAMIVSFASLIIAIIALLLQLSE